MNHYRMQFAPGVWKPKLHPTLLRWLRPLRMRHQHRVQQLFDSDVIGHEKVREVLDAGHGVMIMPNHPSHADPFSIYLAGDAIGTALYVMATWHVFYGKPKLTQRILQWHGCFSVDREANDIGAFRQAVELLEKKREPLVIFPEGEIYHCNDRVTPFREGAAAIAVAAARRAKRPIQCIPCAISYRYLDDPTPRLQTLMGDLEEAILWRRRDYEPLERRIYRFAEALLALKELEYFGACSEGELRDRICHFRDRILERVETRWELNSTGQSIPERVKAARRVLIEKRGEQKLPEDADARATLERDLDDLFVVVQSFSYPGDYVEQQPSLERMAETLDKFEEDVLRKSTASIKGNRKVSIAFGDPIEVSTDRKYKTQARDISRHAEQSVQTLLDELRGSGH